MSKFNEGDIVVVVNHMEIHPNWFKLMPIGLITCIVKGAFWSLGKTDEAIMLLDNKPAKTIKSALRLANEREQFLYHINNGPFVLKE